MGTFTRGDTVPHLSGIVTSAGQAVSIAGATLAVHVEQPDGGPVLTLTGTPGEAIGSWSAPWPDGGIQQCGTHAVEVQVTWASGGIQTFGKARFIVDEQIG